MNEVQFCECKTESLVGFRRSEPERVGVEIAELVLETIIGSAIYTFRSAPFRAYRSYLNQLTYVIPST